MSLRSKGSGDPPPVRRIPIDWIRVGKRHRRDPGDLDGLAASMREIGQLQPVGVRPDMTLVFGARRLAAAQKLGWEWVDARVFDDLADAASALRAERDENLHRKEMLPSELVSLGEELEEVERQAAITADTVSGHRMYAGEGRRPNTLTYVLTLNGASLSKDMAQRSVVIKLARPRYSPAWEEETLAYVRDHRPAILGDLVAILRTPGTAIGTVGRFGAWERAVLSRVGSPAACQRAIAERQAAADEDQDEADRVRAEFVQVVREHGRDPETGAFRFDSKAATEIVARAKCERQTATAASALLKALAIRELVKKKYAGLMYWTWTGAGHQGSGGILVTFDPVRRQFRFGTDPQDDGC